MTLEPLIAALENSAKNAEDFLNKYDTLDPILTEHYYYEIMHMLSWSGHYLHNPEPDQPFSFYKALVHFSTFFDRINEKLKIDCWIFLEK